MTASIIIACSFGLGVGITGVLQDLLKWPRSSGDIALALVLALIAFAGLCVVLQAFDDAIEIAGGAA